MDKIFFFLYPGLSELILCIFFLFICYNAIFDHQILISKHQLNAALVTNVDYFIFISEDKEISKKFILWDIPRELAINKYSSKSAEVKY